MKKILLVLTVLLLAFTLSGCDAVEPVVIVETEIVEVPTIIIQTEIVEVPTTIIVKEIEVVEIPVVTTVIHEVEVEVPVYIETTDVRTTFYQTGYSDEIIFVISKAHEAYVFEFRYTDTLTNPPTMHFSQIAYQYDGVDIIWLFLEEMPDYEGIEVVDYDDFLEEVQEIVDGMTWEDAEEGFDILYDLYYSIELEYEDVFIIGESIIGTLTMENYTDVLLLKFLEETTVTITVTTSEMIDINLYYTSFIHYEFDNFLTFPTGTSTQIYTFEAGSHLLELENYYDFDSVDYTITITINE